MFFKSLNNPYNFLNMLFSKKKKKRFLRTLANESSVRNFNQTLLDNLLKLLDFPKYPGAGTETLVTHVTLFPINEPVMCMH